MSQPVTYSPDHPLPAIDDVLWWDMNYHGRLIRNPLFYSPGEVDLTEETYRLLLQETDERPFQIIADQPEPFLAPEDRLLVGTGQKPCPLCKGTTKAQEVFRLAIGRRTGVFVALPRPCSCAIYRKYYSEWMKPEHVSTAYRDCTWDNLYAGRLQGRFKHIPEQFYFTILAALQAFPSFNTLMVGPTGAGKSTLMTVLYDRALIKWATRCYEGNVEGLAVYKMPMLRLATELRDWAMRSTDPEDTGPRPPLPKVTVSKLMANMNETNRFVPHVSLDEFDKYKNSEFQNNQILDILTCLQENGGQAVCCSNLNVRSLTWKVGEQHAGPILRRLVDEPRGMLIDFFQKKVYVNRIHHVLRKEGLVPDFTEILPVDKLATKGLTAPKQELVEWSFLNPIKEPPQVEQPKAMPVLADLAEALAHWDSGIPAGKSESEPEGEKGAVPSEVSSPASKSNPSPASSPRAASPVFSPPARSFPGRPANSGRPRSIGGSGKRLNTRDKH